MSESVRDAVSQCPLEFGPDKLIEIKLWGIAGEAVGLQTGMDYEESFNRHCPVGRIPVPEKDDHSPKVFKQMAQEPNRLLSLDVFIGVETDVKPDLSPLRRNTDKPRSRIS